MSSSFDFSKNKIPAKLQQNQSSNKSAVGELEYDDQRGESVAQLQLQETANQSNGVAQLLEIEDQANDSQQVTQLMDLQETINEPQTQEETIQNQESPIQLQSSNDGVVQMLRHAQPSNAANKTRDRSDATEETRQEGDVEDAEKRKSPRRKQHFELAANEEAAETALEEANIDGARDKKLAEFKKQGMVEKDGKLVPSEDVRKRMQEQKGKVDGTTDRPDGTKSNDVTTLNPKEIKAKQKIDNTKEGPGNVILDDRETIEYITKLVRESGAHGREYDTAWFTDGREFVQGKEITNWAASDAKKFKLPHWSSYLSHEFVGKHLAKFDAGGHAFIPMAAHKKVMGLNITVDFKGWGNEWQFISPIDEANVLSDDAQNDQGIKTLEKVCGLPEASWAKGADNKIARYFISPAPKGTGLSEEEAKKQVEMVTGREYGAHVDFWNAGGITSGGLSEAMIRAVPRDVLLFRISSNNIIQDIETYPSTPPVEGGKYVASDP